MVGEQALPLSHPCAHRSDGTINRTAAAAELYGHFILDRCSVICDEVDVEFRGKLVRSPNGAFIEGCVTCVDVTLLPQRAIVFRSTSFPMSPRSYPAK